MSGVPYYAVVAGNDPRLTWVCQEASLGNSLNLGAENWIPTLLFEVSHATPAPKGGR